MRDLGDELLQAKVKAKLFGGEHSPRLGRLVILERIGSGAMGTVFAAYDPKLERKVAVKLLRAAPDANTRVLAEARALAKLTHPNVVAVYDVGEVDGIVHIVMELAPGVPLRAWIGGGHDWKAIVAVMREAGTGIAAAHRAGLAHRDIKPDNILIGDDRTRVVDFGLAHERAGDDNASAGTPHYMAPETLAGAPATELSDQFSFGVTLYEVLHGKRPHGGKTRDELHTAAQGAAQARPGEDTIVPARIQQVIARALAPDPNSRFTSMTALLDALRPPRKRKRLVLAVSAAALVAAAAVGAVAYRSQAGGDPCTGAAARRAAVWTDAARARVRAALGTAAWAPMTVAALDDSATRWEASYRRVCEATRVRGEQSDTLLDLRMRCLDRALDRFGALTTALGDADKLDTNARVAAPTAIADLPPPDACEALSDPGELAMPTDRIERARVDAAEHQIDQAWAAFGLGHYKAAQTIAAGIPTNLSAPGAQAQVLALAAAIEARVGDPSTARTRTEQALTAAAAAHAPQLELEVWSRTLRGELFAGNPTHVIEWAQFARAAAARAGREGAELDGIVAEALRDSGQVGAARSVLDRALASKDPLRPGQRALLEMNLGAVELASGDSAGALAMFQRAYNRVRTALGYGHPELALYLDKLASAQCARGRIRDALAVHGESLALRIAAFGPDDRSIATSLFHRAQTRLEAGDANDARADLQRAHEIRERVFGPHSPRLGEIDLAMADVLAARADPSAATAYTLAVTEDPRLEIGWRRFAIGEPVELATIPPLDPQETLSNDRAAVLATRVALLVRAQQTAEAATLAHALQARFRKELDPVLTNSIGSALLAIGDRDHAAAVYGAAAAKLGNEPTRTALATFTGLARSTDGPQAAQAARVAISLFQAMPQLGRADYAAIDELSR